MSDRPIITLAEAKAAGLKRYYTGVPCKHGHLTERQTSNGTCMKCTAINTSVRTAANRGPANRRNKEYAARVKADPVKSARLTAARREYDRANRERHRLRLNEWRANNPDAYAAQKAARRAREAGAEGFYTPEDIQRIHKDQRGRCAICKTKLTKSYHRDHIISLYHGGSNWPSNIQLLCRPCNTRKNRKDPIEFARELGMLL